MMNRYTILPSVTLFGLNTVLSTIVGGLSVYHLLTNESTNAPIAPNETWICFITALLPFSVVWMLVSMAGTFMSLSKRQLILASLVLVCYIAIFGGAVYFTVTAASHLEMEDVSASQLYEKTAKEINLRSPERWIPNWLDNIQKQSKQCCGVVTYRDFEAFWPTEPTKLPRSCCRDLKELNETCPEDLTRIPFPHTPGNFIKVEMGCMQEINDAVRRNVQETLDLCITATTFIACALIAFAVLYFQRYIVGRPGRSPKASTEEKPGGGDAVVVVGSKENLNVMIDSGSYFISSNGQFIGTMDSLAGVPNLASAQSLMVQERKPMVMVPEVPLQSNSRDDLGLGVPPIVPKSSGSDPTYYDPYPLPSSQAPPPPMPQTLSSQQPPMPQASSPRPPPMPQASYPSSPPMPQTLSSQQPPMPQTFSSQQPPMPQSSSPRSPPMQQASSPRPPPVARTSSPPPPPPMPQASSPPQIRSQPSAFRVNKANAVFAGLQRQASTGEDMSVGGGNMGRREVYVVQDSELPVIPEVASQQRNLAVSSRAKIPPAASQNDLAGDVIHVDPEPDLTPGPDPAPTNKPDKAKQRKKGIRWRQKK